MVSVTVSQLAELVGGEVLGDGDVRITGASTIRDAGPGDITLADDPKNVGRLKNCGAAAAVVSEGASVEGLPQIIVKDVHAAFGKIVLHFRPLGRSEHQGISPAAHVCESAIVGDDVSIYPGAFVGEGVEIGDGCVIHSGACVLAGSKLADHVTVFPNAVLYEGTVVGPRCIIHAGAVIGAYGFGYQTSDGQHRLTAQLGYVEIGADVEIGACTTIDRGTYGPTVIGEGTKIDNQVMIAHNCRIGRHNIVCSQVGIAGSCSTGDYAVMAGQVGIADHLHIGAQVTLGAQAGVIGDVPDGATYFGTPARPYRRQMAKFAAFEKLPEIRKEVRALRQKVDQLVERFNWPSDKKDAA